MLPVVTCDPSLIGTGHPRSSIYTEKQLQQCLAVWLLRLANENLLMRH